MTAHSSPCIAQPDRLPLRFLALCRLGRRLSSRWYGRYLQRLDLAEIDDHLLRDLGLTRKDVRRECAKSFWQI